MSFNININTRNVLNYTNNPRSTYIKHILKTKQKQQSQWHANLASQAQRFRHHSSWETQKDQVVLDPVPAGAEFESRCNTCVVPIGSFPSFETFPQVREIKVNCQQCQQKPK